MLIGLMGRRKKIKEVSPPMDRLSFIGQLYERGDINLVDFLEATDEVDPDEPFKLIANLVSDTGYVSGYAYAEADDARDVEFKDWVDIVPGKYSKFQVMGLFGPKPVLFNLYAPMQIGSGDQITIRLNIG